MQSDYAIRYRELYRNHWWWRAREVAILEQIRQLGFLPDGSQTMLDVGCGDGLLFDCLEPFGLVCGVEGDATTLDENGRWRHRIFQQPFDESFLPEVRFDLILMLDLLEHLPDPERALRHARRLLKPGGRLLMTVPAFNALWTTHDDLNHHFVRYDRRSFHRLAAAAGVTLEKCSYFFHWTFPVKLLIRLRESLTNVRAAPPAIPANWINRTCYALTRLEQRTLTRLGPPFGSSLLAVGSGAEC
jgi:SAM-dependent methyltransferase